MSDEMQYPTTFVVSDLHIGAGKTDDFDLELEHSFIGFLDYLSSMAEKTELVINGDFLDFAQAPPTRDPCLRSRSPEGVPLCFTQDQSLKKLASIHDAHKAVFRALRTYLCNGSGSRLVILPGNHDVDFFWPHIRKAFTHFVGGSSAVGDRLVFHLESAYHPPGKSTVHIEHGHRYDPCNCFKVDDAEYWSANTPPLLRDDSGEDRLLECVGTRFLNRTVK